MQTPPVEAGGFFVFHAKIAFINLLIADFKTYQYNYISSTSKPL